MSLRSVDVVDLYVEPYIRSGFRLPNQPYSYYYRSLFNLHNETLSVWIHLLGTVVLVKQLIDQSHELTSIYLIYNCVGACVMLLCSSHAHLLHSRTIADHIRSFYFDYFGINFYGFTSGLVLRRFSHQVSIDDNQLNYLMILTLLSIYSICVACFCKTFYRRPYPFSHKILQCSGVLLVYFYQNYPILRHILFVNQRELTEFETKSIYWHSLQFLSFIASGLIFICRIPERFRPGSFDLFGQSHHTFHLTIFLMAYSQSNAVFYDMNSFSFEISNEIFLQDLFLTLILLFVQLLTIKIWYRISRPLIEQRYTKE